MPVPIPIPEPTPSPPSPSPTPVTSHTAVSSFVVRDQQPWGVEQVGRELTEALWRYGEYAMFVLFWTLDDFERGLVGRCPVCFTSYGKVTEVFGQSARQKCPACYGTTFEGGYRAKVVRPSVWGDTVTDIVKDRRGEFDASQLQIQIPPDITLHPRDVALRADGTRWEVRLPDNITLRTGFGYDAQDQQVAYTSVPASQLPDTDVAFTIPPEPAVLLPYLRQAGNPAADFSPIEEIRGPLRED